MRTATLAYDAVALVAALAERRARNVLRRKTLTNPSGFAGIDGLFRFRSDGTNERGLAVMKVPAAAARRSRLAEEFWRVASRASRASARSELDALRAA